MPARGRIRKLAMRARIFTKQWHCKGKNVRNIFAVSVPCARGNYGGFVRCAFEVVRKKDLAVSRAFRNYFVAPF